MSDLNALMSRIDAELNAAEGRMKQFKDEKVEEFHGKQQRLEQFVQVCENLREVWRPRLEALGERFGQKVTVTAPAVTPSGRSVSFKFQSELARIELKFSASTDLEVRNLVLAYDLAIVPVLIQYAPNVRLEMPLDAIDPDAVAKWTDDRIVDFVKTYVSVHENQHYLKNFLVEDPIAAVRFPKHAAAGTCDHGGKTYYFISDETLREFKAKHGIAG